MAKPKEDIVFEGFCIADFRDGLFYFRGKGFGDYYADRIGGEVVGFADDGDVEILEFVCSVEGVFEFTFDDD